MQLYYNSIRIRGLSFSIPISMLWERFEKHANIFPLANFTNEFNPSFSIKIKSPPHLQSGRGMAVYMCSLWDQKYFDGYFLWSLSRFSLRFKMTLMKEFYYIGSYDIRASPSFQLQSTFYTTAICRVFEH